MLPFFENKQEEIYAAHHDRIDFPLHLHTHIELYYVEKGTIEVWLDEKWNVINSGELAVIFPGKVHAYRTIRTGKGILILLPLSLAFSLKTIFQQKQPENSVVSKTQMPLRITEDLEEITATFGTPDVQRALSHLVLARIAEVVTLIPRSSYDTDGLLCHVVSEISKRYRSDIRLEDVARVLGVSEGHLSRLLNNSIGVNFCDYVNSLRVNDARYLLENTQYSMLEIALECGFQTLRTFNRAFLHHTGCTPSEYRHKYRM